MRTTTTTTSSYKNNANSLTGNNSPIAALIETYNNLITSLEQLLQLQIKRTEIVILKQGAEQLRSFISEYDSTLTAQSRIISQLQTSNTGDTLQLLNNTTSKQQERNKTLLDESKHIDYDSSIKEITAEVATTTKQIQDLKNTLTYWQSECTKISQATSSSISAEDDTALKQPISLQKQTIEQLQLEIDEYTRQAAQNLTINTKLKNENKRLKKERDQALGHNQNHIETQPHRTRVQTTLQPITTSTNHIETQTLEQQLKEQKRLEEIHKEEIAVLKRKNEQLEAEKKKLQSENFDKLFPPQETHILGEAIGNQYVQQTTTTTSQQHHLYSAPALSQLLPNYGSTTTTSSTPFKPTPASPQQNITIEKSGDQSVRILRQQFEEKIEQQKPAPKRRGRLPDFTGFKNRFQQNKKSSCMSI